MTQLTINLSERQMYAAKQFNDSVSKITRLETFPDVFLEATCKFQFDFYLIKRKMHVGKWSSFQFILLVRFLVLWAWGVIVLFFGLSAN